MDKSYTVLPTFNTKTNESEVFSRKKIKSSWITNEDKQEQKRLFDLIQLNESKLSLLKKRSDRSFKIMGKSKFQLIQNTSLPKIT